MDGNRFDQLAKSVAGASRRSLLRAAAGTLLGGALGAVKLTESEAAAAKRLTGDTCRKDGDCASNLCGPVDSHGRRSCLCASASNCPQPRPGDVCHKASCSETGACTLIVNTGATCDDGNKCTVADACQSNGKCAGIPTICNDANPCTIDTCDPQTGNCVFTPKVCNDNNPCTIDTCDVQTGDCVFTQKDCDDNNACTADSCDQTTGVCVHSKINCDDFNLCTLDSCDPQTGCVYTNVTCPSGSCDAAAGCLCGTSEDCGAGYTCRNGGCFFINSDPNGASQICIDHCGNSTTAFVNGLLVCIAGGPGADVCVDDTGCPAGWACFANQYCVAPCN